MFFLYTSIFVLRVKQYRPIAQDVAAPVTMHLEDKLAIYS
jgi:hypothetical protein